MTPAKRAAIVEGILRREGPGDPAKGYLAPHDRGGRTNYGISEQAHPEEWANGKVPSRERAAAIYDQTYCAPWEWVAPDYLAEHLVDMTVLHGLMNTVRMLQAALGADVDGRLGPQTKALLTSQPAALRHLNNALVGFRLDFMNRVIRHDPSQEGNRRGWTNRAVGFLRLAVLP